MRELEETGKPGVKKKRHLGRRWCSHREKRLNIKKIDGGNYKFLKCLRKESMSYRKKGKNVREMYLYIGNSSIRSSVEVFL